MTSALEDPTWARRDTATPGLVGAASIWLSVIVLLPLAAIGGSPPRADGASSGRRSLPRLPWSLSGLR